MIRYADPGLCPDCHSRITRGMVICATCGLALRGELAQRLFLTLQQADTLLTTLRATSAAPTSAPPASAPPASAPPASPGHAGEPASPTATPPAPAIPASATPPAAAIPGSATPAPAPAGLSAASVPRILLTLGAGCLLVAALVFLAVTWSVLGVGGRTAILIAFTLIAAGLAGLLARRGLRGAAEALALVAYGLLTLDLAGAAGAGWFGDLSRPGLFVLIGIVLVLTGAGGALAVRRIAPDDDLGSGQVVAALGTALVTIGLQGDWKDPGPTLLLAVLLVAAAVLIAARLTLRLTAGGAALVAAAAWLGLTGYGLGEVFSADGDWHALWVDLQVWPLLAAAVLVAAPALVRQLPVRGRVGAAAVGHLLLATAIAAPVANLEPTEIALVALGVLLLTTALTLLLPQPWGLVNVLTQAVAAVYALVVALVLAGRSASGLVEAADFSWRSGWSGAAGDSLPAADGAYLEVAQHANWLLPLCVLCLAAAAWTTRAAVPPRVRLPLPGAPSSTQFRPPHLSVPAAAVAAVALLTLALYPVPIWIVLTGLLLVTVVFAWWWTRHQTPQPLLVGIMFAAAALALGSHALWLAGPALLVVTAATALVHLRGRDDDLACGAGVTAALGLGALVWVWGTVAGLGVNGRAVLAAAVLAVLVLGVGYLPGRFWRARTRTAWLGLEIGAALVFVPIAGSAVALTAPDDRATWAAVHLTLAGAVVTALALLRPGRRMLAWAGGALLVAASWIRLWDIGVHAPEPYTVPTALVLLAIGMVRLRRDRTVPTLPALGPGLGLALVPTLLWTLADPVGLRSLLLGLAVLGLVLAGAWWRWAAPVLAGGAVGAILVLRLAGPFVGAAVPRWVLIGLAGALLLAVGATWERRLQEARRVGAYFRDLR